MRRLPPRQGVVNGNYRCSYLGFDLNRHWLTPSAWAQPEILSVKTLVTELHEDPSADLDFYVGEIRSLSICCSYATPIWYCNKKQGAMKHLVFGEALATCRCQGDLPCVVSRRANLA